MNGAVNLFSQRAGYKPGDKILEVGSLNVNGSVRGNFPDAGEYIGIDMRPGREVDVVATAEDLPELYGPEHFDLVLCLETLEHCEFWKQALKGTWHVLKTGGKLCLTTPLRNKGRHNYPNDYWRWEKADYKKIFKDQHIWKLEDVAPGIGVLVEKVTPDLCYDVDPYKVP